MLPVLPKSRVMLELQDIQGRNVKKVILRSVVLMEWILQEI
jgi:hypothetical protein